jgi:hypothetical protein
MVVFDFAIVFILLRAMGDVPSSSASDKAKRGFLDVYIQYAHSIYSAPFYSQKPELQSRKSPFNSSCGTARCVSPTTQGSI